MTQQLSDSVVRLHGLIYLHYNLGEASRWSSLYSPATSNSCRLQEEDLAAASIPEEDKRQIMKNIGDLDKMRETD